MRLSHLAAALSAVLYLGVAPALAQHDHGEYEYPVTPPATLFRTVADGQHSTLRLYGEVMPFAGGSVETWLAVTTKGLYKVGLTLSPETLVPDNLPAYGATHGAHMRFPRVPGSPFVHAFFGWNHHGHGPSPIYDVPHFDFHLTFIEADELMAIRYDDPKGQLVPPPNYLPSSAIPQRYPDGSYINVPGQGVHWYYTDAAEWNGGSFTETFLWGSFDAKVTFMEPMITYATIMDKPAYEKRIALPACVAKSGFYPRVYGWQHKRNADDKLYIEVYMRDFLFKAAPKPGTTC